MRILADHARTGKRFVPPFVHMLGPMQEVKWVDSPLPELLWLALLNHRHGFQRGAELALAIAKAAAAALPPGDQRWLVSTSAYGTLTTEQRQHIASDLSAKGFLEDARDALGDLVALYPECPLAFLCEGAMPEREQPERVRELKTILAGLFDKTSTEAIRMQANAVYIAFVTGRLRVSASTSLANFPAVEYYPDTEESRRVAAAVRSTIPIFFGQPHDVGSSWPRYFWNRGLEIDECLFLTEDGDE